MSVADKITKFATDINSAYSAIQTKGGTVPEHKNTENLADAIGSIEGGSDQILEQLRAFAEVVNASGKMSASYNKTYDTTDPVTLYTPDTSCQHYCIQYRSSGKFRVVWFQTACVGCGVGAAYGVVNADPLESVLQAFTGSSRFHVDDEGVAVGTYNVTLAAWQWVANYNIDIQLFDPGTVFISSEMDTIEDCIDALENNTTVYAPTTSKLSMGGANYNGTGTSIVLSNLIEVERINGSNLNTDTPIYEIITNLSGRQISSNETIVVQGNA